jgi:hypothetical protein
MLSAHTPADVTVLRLLRCDPHVSDTHVFQALSLLVERSELAHLERIVAAMLCQLQLNWPDRYWKCRFDRLVVTASKGQSNRVIAKMEPAICLLLCRACVRLPYKPAPIEEQIHAKVISPMVTPCPAVHTRC